MARLADPRFAGTGMVMPMDAEARAVGAAAPTTSEGLDAPDPAQSTAPTAVPLPSAGAPLSWGVRPVVLVSAELTLAATPLGDGTMVLLPTYLLTDADGGTWQVPAVSDAGLGLA